MQNRILDCDVDAFESHYRLQCEAHDSAVAARIAKVDLDYYGDRQFDAYCKAIKKAKATQAPAIYFEYDLDNDWKSSFFVCKKYTPPEVGNDDWACHWHSAVPGSCIPEFAQIYDSTDKFCRTPHATAITLYLIARTSSAIKRLSMRKPSGIVKLCMAYHDQDPIHRLVP